jgi:TfoX/Sxy family transcriptional regulator of competence genes
MASQQRTIDFLLEQLAALESVSARPMFGEWALYCDGKVAALICGDQLFVKPTEAGRAIAPDAELAPAYRGAKPSLLIEADHWDDAEWLCGLIRATAAALPMPKPKKPKKKA